MRRHSQIALFLIGLVPFFFMGNVLFANDVSYELEATSESLIIEEEREISIEFQEIIDETPDISGGNPDTISNITSTELSKEATLIVLTEDIKSKHISKCFYLGKLPLYLRYQALKLNC